MKIKRIAPYAALSATGVLVATAFAGMAALGSGTPEIPTRDEAPAVQQVGDATSVTPSETSTEASEDAESTPDEVAPTDVPAATTEQQSDIVVPAPPVTQTPAPPVQVRTEADEPEQPPVEEPDPEPEPEQPPVEDTGPPTSTHAPPPEAPLMPGECRADDGGVYYCGDGGY